MGLNSMGLNSMGLNSIGLNSIGLNSMGLNSIGLGRWRRSGLPALLAAAGLAWSAPGQAEIGELEAGGAPPPLGLDQLIEQFNAEAPPATDNVDLDAWVESTADGPQVVVRITPRGKVKLVADPGITVMPEARSGVTWRVALPLHHADPQLEYFTPPALVRLPFAGGDDQPIDLLVEYAYCLVDFQCFFGEETLSVALP